jgi:hypothetical protein
LGFVTNGALIGEAKGAHKSASLPQNTGAGPTKWRSNRPLRRAFWSELHGLMIIMQSGTTPMQICANGCRIDRFRIEPLLELLHRARELSADPVLHGQDRSFAIACGILGRFLDEHWIDRHFLESQLYQPLIEI